MGSSENTNLCDFTSHNNNEFTCTPIAPPATSAVSYEIKPALLNLVMKEQFYGVGEDSSLHLNNFVEICDMQKYKEVDGDIVKLKLFPFSLRGRFQVLRDRMMGEDQGVPKPKLGDAPLHPQEIFK